MVMAEMMLMLRWSYRNWVSVKAWKLSSYGNWISMKACYKLILRFFYGYGQAFPKFPEKQVCNVCTVSLKKLEMKLTFLVQISIKFPNSWFQDFGHQNFLQCDGHDHENVKDMVMGMIKHSQSTQSNKFAMSLQYL